MRLVILRTALVLGKDGGALPRLAMPFKFFGGGTMGRRDQWVSWIHLDDEIGLIAFAITHPEMHGVVNAAAPNPVTMQQFSQQIGRAMRRPTWAPMLWLPMKLAMGQRARESWPASV